MRAVALEALDELEQSFKEGHEGVLMQAIEACAISDVSLPDWLAAAVIERTRAMLWGRVDSWDKVFPPPFKKGTRLSKVEPNAVLATKISLRIAEIRRATPRVPLDNELFESVGKEFGVSRSQCSKLYYAATNMVGQDLFVRAITRLISKAAT